MLENEEDNPFLFRLLTVLEKKYSIRAIINTSFNARGKTLVHTHEEAIHTAERMNLDAVVLNGHLKKSGLLVQNLFNKFTIKLLQMI